jgi:twitching motility protein PilT
MNGAVAEIKLSDFVYAARRRGASDLHLIPGARPALRVDGHIEWLGASPIAASDTEELAGALFESGDRDALRRGADRSRVWQSADFGRVRVHGFSCEAGIAIAARLLYERVPSIEALRLPPVVAGFSAYRRGLVIFAGPTGSGKSSSMAALLQEIIATSARRIVTIEDPIEYRHDHAASLVTQREVGLHAETYAAAVIGSLRADPDVMAIGEMRDAETMRAVLTAAETGHLVLATIHTGSAVQTIERIVDAFRGSEQSQVRAQLAAVLMAVVCQRLVPRRDAPGRRPVVEVLLANDAVRNVIRESRTHQLQNVMLSGREIGMQTFEDHLQVLRETREVADSFEPSAT